MIPIGSLAAEAAHAIVVPQLGVGDAAIAEGTSTARTLIFAVTLDEPATANVSVQYRIVAGTATAGVDVDTARGAARTLLFRTGASGRTPVMRRVVVKILPDVIIEPDETFTVELTNPSGATIVRATGLGTIIDDETVRRPLMGTAVRSATLAQEPAYASIAGSRFDLLTPENEMKWDVVEPQRGGFDFSAPDAIANFAVEHGQTVHGHTLAWHQQNPAWLTAGGFTRPELIDILTNHIATVVGRYRGVVSMWDVVNEAIGDNALVRPSVWTTGIGADAYDLAFFAARAADPNAKLYINDYNIEGPSSKSDALYALVSGMVTRGVPVDGVGFQTHRTLGSINVPGLRSQFDRYAALGLDVAITELDVRIPVPATATDLAAQAATYAVARDACLAAPNCRSITTWGFTDKHSWIPYFFTGLGAALPWDASLAPKPAYDVIAPLLRN